MKRPNYTDMFEAARVSNFITAAEHGRWRIQEFEQTMDDFMRQRIEAAHKWSSEFRREIAIDRVVPPGHYVSLQRRATEREMEESESARHYGFHPVMSDTPAEINEHQHAFVYAEGRVLIHGLGLGLLVSALLAKPEVTHIDVVEIDPDVIALTGHYYTHDPRVHIHRGDCLTFNWSPDLTWDYVWHDIWSDISDKNFDPELAEHGITYQMLFELFDGRAEVQGAWAYPEALEMEEDRRETERENEEWIERFFSLTDHDARVEMAFDYIVRQKMVLADGTPAFAADEPLPDDVRQFWADSGLLKALEERLSDPNFSREEFERKSAAKNTPLGNPNEALEV